MLIEGGGRVVVVVVFEVDVIALVMCLVTSAWNTMMPPLLRQRSSPLKTRRMALRMVTLVPGSPAGPVAAAAAAAAPAPAAGCKTKSINGKKVGMDQSNAHHISEKNVESSQDELKSVYRRRANYERGNGKGKEVRTPHGGEMYGQRWDFK